MAGKKSPGLWIETGVDGKFCAFMVDLDGQEKRLPPITPAEDLVGAAEIDYGTYRQKIQKLYEEHPLFEDKLDISMLDLEDLAAEALMLPSMLQKTDPLGFFEVGWFLDQALRTKDDRSALFLLRAGRRLLRILEIPIRTQIRLQNIMEMTFDGMERATQQERFEKLRGVYLNIAAFCNPSRLATKMFHYSFVLLLFFNCVWQNSFCISSKTRDASLDATTAGIISSPEPGRQHATATGFLKGRAVKSGAPISNVKEVLNRTTP